MKLTTCPPAPCRGEYSADGKSGFLTTRADGSDGADAEQSKSEPPPTPSAKPKVAVPLGLAAKSAASLLYQIGRFFEAQRPWPAAGPRVEVDSKLKRKIREKKIAMGHKPDDHEEQTMQ